MSDKNENVSLNVEEENQSENESDENQSENESEENQSEERVEIPLVLLYNVKSIIEIMTSRGGFRANELVAVGQIYQNISKLIPESK